MNDFTGWTIVKDGPDGSLLIQAPNGERKRIWQGDGQAVSPIRSAEVQTAMEYADCNAMAGDKRILLTRFRCATQVLAKYARALERAIADSGG